MANARVENRKPTRFEPDYKNRIPRRVEKQGFPAPFHIPLWRDVPQGRKTLLTRLGVCMRKQHVPVRTEVAIRTIQRLWAAFREVARKGIDRRLVQWQILAILRRHIDRPVQKCLGIGAGRLRSRKRRSVKPVEQTQRLLVRQQTIDDDQRHSLDCPLPHPIFSHCGLALSYYVTSK